MSVSIESWYADIVNYLSTSDSLSGPLKTNTNSSPKWSTSFGMTHIYSNNILIKSLEGVSQTMRLGAFYLFIMTKLVLVILGPKRLLQKLFNVNFIGPIYLEMHMSTIKITLDANK